MKFAAWKLNFLIAEVPITFIDRKYGESKMNKGIVKEGILGVLKLRWMSMFKSYRKNVKNKSPYFIGEDNSTFQSPEVAIERK